MTRSEFDNDQDFYSEITLNCNIFVQKLMNIYENLKQDVGYK